MLQMALCKPYEVAHFSVHGSLLGKLIAYMQKLYDNLGIEYPLECRGADLHNGQSCPGVTQCEVARKREAFNCEVIRAIRLVLSPEYGERVDMPLLPGRELTRELLESMEAGIILEDGQCVRPDGLAMLFRTRRSLKSLWLLALRTTYHVCIACSWQFASVCRLQLLLVAPLRAGAL